MRGYRAVIGNPPAGPGSIKLIIVFGGSTLTSTIPGISIAGPSPQATLWTPTLDLEYLIGGSPVSLYTVPVSPQGLPTPAVVTRALAPATGISILAVDSGLFHGARVPAVKLPSARPGGRIDSGPALSGGAAESIFREARTLASNIGRGLRGASVALGETIPGGTTTAAAIMEALGLPGVEWVSSSGRDNPKGIKARVAGRAAERARRSCGEGDVFCVVEEAGDPVHIAVAGAAAGFMDEGVNVFLAGGTQMGAVLAVLKELGFKVGGLTVATTRWVLDDPTSDLESMVRSLGASLIVSTVSFADAPGGLRMYEEGYVKEGVAAGASLAAASEVLGVEEVKRLVYREYERLGSLASRG